ncbi:MAG TPA: PDZ domain-containing protein [SAR324 cluster bacterium]|nr:PDZ domain-containing protein [SAR324 cluster bacterium]
MQTNDIILEVNGYTVDSVAKALKLLEALQSEREISLKIEREGQPIDFSYFID